MPQTNVETLQKVVDAMLQDGYSLCAYYMGGTYNIDVLQTTDVGEKIFVETIIGTSLVDVVTQLLPYA